ncbi:MAG: hypothetical protein PUI73_08530 [bacterium]|nr:hypothetical protein [bacterium]MDY5457281.1 hypothetical protein [Bariatricus sp.]
MNKKQQEIKANKCQNMPDLHNIAYPEGYKDRLMKEGASAFAGRTDHANSRYYVFVTIQNHPYSKMKSGWPEIAFLIAS